MYKNKKIGVVIPAYNEEMFIATVVGRIPEYIDRIYVIDDASTDRTGYVVSKLAISSPRRIRIIRHEQNGGVGKAIMTGYKGCLIDDMDIAVVMAGDNQMNPEQLPRLLDPIAENEADYTAGNRISNLQHMKSMSYWRRLGNLILTWLTRIAAWNFNIWDPQNGYTAVNQRALARLDLDNIYPRYGYCNDILIKLSAIKARIKYIPMPAVYGSEKSKIRYSHYIPTISWLLLKGFFWTTKIRLSQYTKKLNLQSDVRV
jgi:glycosyltransferase involved in cell wall biosynthesis